MIRVLLVDDHHLVRVGLRSLLEEHEDVAVVGEARDGREALDLLAADSDVDVVLMDLSMPVLDGVGATRELRRRGHQARVLVLTSFADRTRVQDALEAGAQGYLLKDAEPGQLLDAVRAAARGHHPLDPRVAGVLLPRSDLTRSDLPRRSGDRSEVDGTAFGGLSQREAEVLRLVAQGLANKQIGRALGIAERTVKAHLGSIFRTIGVSDRTSAALWARDHLDPAADPSADEEDRQQRDE